MHVIHRNKTAGVTRHALSSSDGKKYQVQQPLKIRKYSLNVHKLGGALLQYMNNNYAYNKPALSGHSKKTKTWFSRPITT